MKRAAGFTLLELLLALSAMALMAVLGWRGLDAMARSQSALDRHADQVLALRELLPSRPRGIVAQRTYEDEYWSHLTQAQRDSMLYLRHGFRTQPHFVAFKVDHLPAPAPWIARNVFGCALLGWTVRTPEQRTRVGQYADQMIFEGFVP